MFVRLALMAAVLLACALPTTATRAYCRTHTDDPRQSTCPERCASAGTPLAWPTSEIRYGFNDRGFPGLTDAQLRKTFAASFAAWEGVACDGEPVGFRTTQIPGTTPLGVGPVLLEPNENVIVLYDAAGWAAQDNSARAFAVTAVWFCPSDAKSCAPGDIFGADISFNGGMGLYGDCAVDTCSSAGPTADLQNVATHEIGHFFGLSHSDVVGSTMFCDAAAADTDKRSLSPDDIAGLCASYPPQSAFPGDQPSDAAGCACSTFVRPHARVRTSMGGGSPLGALTVFALVLSLVQRRRRATRRAARRDH